MRWICDLDTPLRCASAPVEISPCAMATRSQSGDRMLSVTSSAMPHICGAEKHFLEARRGAPLGDNRGDMRPAQIPIVGWMRDMIAKHDLSARGWSVKAGLGKDTVSRAMRDDYEHVTSTATIVKLADAIGERGPAGAVAIPTVEALQSILETLANQLAPGSLPSDLILTTFAEALRDTLLHLADEPAALSDPRASRLLARAAARQLSR
jgi:hypothetical protein